MTRRAPRSEGAGRPTNLRNSMMEEILSKTCHSWLPSESQDEVCGRWKKREVERNIHEDYPRKRERTMWRLPFPGTLMLQLIFSCFYYVFKITSSGCGELFPQWSIWGRRSAHRDTPRIWVTWEGISCLQSN